MLVAPAADACQQMADSTVQAELQKLQQSALQSNVVSVCPHRSCIYLTRWQEHYLDVVVENEQTQEVVVNAPDVPENGLPDLVSFRRLTCRDSPSQDQEPVAAEPPAAPDATPTPERSLMSPAVPASPAVRPPLIVPADPLPSGLVSPRRDSVEQPVLASDGSG